MLKRKERIVAGLIFLVVNVFLIFDISEDLFNGSSIEHVLKEIFIVILGLFGVLYLWFQYFKTRKNYKQSSRELLLIQADLKAYKEETRALYEGLSQKIDEQFVTWKLSPAEKDIALLILKGLSNKEVAEIRETSDATIRQQTTAVYKKSGLRGRSELSAFFLEDLILL